MQRTKRTPKRKTNAPKPRYRVRNWAQYDRALVQRAALTLWIADDLPNHWCPPATPKRGAPQRYSDHAIEVMLTLREVYQLTNRAVEGLMRSIFQLAQIDLPVPDHTTLSRRGRKVSVGVPKRSRGEPLHLAIDSIGLKVYGEGEWQVRQHGASKRRTWRKVDLAVDCATGTVAAVAVTEARVHDSTVMEALLSQVACPLASVAADGAYDRRRVYAALMRHSPGVQIAIPPRRDARIWQHGNCKVPPHPRDENLRFIRRYGRGRWRVWCGYGRRNRAECLVSRLKRLFGSGLRGRLLSVQDVSVRIRCRALDVMTGLGMPESYAVVAG
jgi:IS5 family transposase